MQPRGQVLHTCVSPFPSKRVPEVKFGHLAFRDKFAFICLSIPTRFRYWSPTCIHLEPALPDDFFLGCVSDSAAAAGVFVKVKLTSLWIAISDD